MTAGIDTALESVTYSSTVATNALLEKKGAQVALFTNAGLKTLSRSAVRIATTFTRWPLRGPSRS